jgi:hypothetical protein
MNDPPSMGLVWEWGHRAIYYAHNRGHKNLDIYCRKRPPTSNMIVVLLHCRIQKDWKKKLACGFAYNIQIFQKTQQASYY